MKEALHLKKTKRKDKDNNPEYTYAKAPQMWSSTDFQKVLDIIKNVQVPTNFWSPMSYKIRDKMVGFQNT